jgi:hypothetical protein
LSDEIHGDRVMVRKTNARPAVTTRHPNAHFEEAGKDQPESGNSTGAQVGRTAIWNIGGVAPVSAALRRYSRCRNGAWHHLAPKKGWTAGYLVVRRAVRGELEEGEKWAWSNCPPFFRGGGVCWLGFG